MEAPGKKKYQCKYPSCNNCFPKSPEYLKLWKNACNFSSAVQAKYWKICEVHFDSKDFVNESKYRLNPNAIPLCVTVNSGQLAPISEQSREGEDVSTLENSASFSCSCFDQPSTSTQTCSCLKIQPDLSHSQSSKVTGNSSDNVQDHDYLGRSYDENLGGNSKYSFLDERGSGILHKIGLAKKDLSPRKSTMYKVLRNVNSKVCKLRDLLKTERNNVNILEKLYKAGKFQFIEENLNFVSKEFINSQLRNASKKPSARRWTEQDKAFALSLYKRSPRLYRYLQAYFHLPSTRALKHMLCKIPFETGINPAVLGYLEGHVKKMKNADRYCALLFDEISLSQGFHYEHHKQIISGFEDLGSLGRANKVANHALVFMIKGIRKQWKQVVAYYFTVNTIGTDNLKVLIREIIGRLQGIGLTVVATVCDQGSTNQSALSKLCAERHPRQSPYYFFVNNQPIVTVYDVPHLLKNTRNALLRCKIQFEPQKFAKFEYIQSVFDLDQKKSFKSLPKLKREHFNFKDSYVKMKVKVAAAQLSNSVAAAIETYSTFVPSLPSESIFTAEFVHKIDELFDSLNGSSLRSPDSKRYRCALTQTSPHLALWKKLLTELNQWKLIDLKTGADVTSQFSFIRGWSTTIKSVIFLWDHLQKVDDFNFLNVRGLNQDPVENLFCTVRQHGVSNDNPTCHQFVAALKTVVVNRLVSPVGGGNCEDDLCMPLDNLGTLLKYSADENNEVSQPDTVTDFQSLEVTDLVCEDSQGLAYVAGYILKSITVPSCEACHQYLYSEEQTNYHVFTSFKELDNKQRLTYASERVMLFIQDIHDNLYKFLDVYGFRPSLEDTFKELYKSKCGTRELYCREHNCDSLILEKCTTFLIFKYVKDKRKPKPVTGGHLKKLKKF